MISTITIVIPAYNEEAIIERTLHTLFGVLDSSSLAREHLKVVVADNGSHDRTATIVSAYGAREPRLQLLSIPQQGKGNAVLTAWRTFPADVNVFLDADLSADPAALPELVETLSRGADIAVASRFVRGAVVTRSIGRRFFSRNLRFLLWALFRLHVRDAPCGMKAVRRRVVEKLVPLIRDRAWFFDTELLIRAERQGFRIVEIPVTWSDAADHDRPSRVSMARTVWSYVKAMIRLRCTV